MNAVREIVTPAIWAAKERVQREWASYERLPTDANYIRYLEADDALLRLKLEQAESGVMG